MTKPTSKGDGMHLHPSSCSKELLDDGAIQTINSKPNPYENGGTGFEMKFNNMLIHADGAYHGYLEHHIGLAAQKLSYMEMGPRWSCELSQHGFQLKCDASQLIGLIRQEGFVDFYEVINAPKDSITYFKRNPGEIFRLSFNELRRLGNVSGRSFDREIFDKVLKFVHDNRSIQQKRGEVYVLVQSNSGLQPCLIGEDYHEIERFNYSKLVLDAYDKTVLEFNKEKSNGFISIFSGPTGSGKTFILRSILGNIKNAKFLFMPADLIRGAAGPQLISVLQDMSEELGFDEDDEDLLMQNSSGGLCGAPTGNSVQKQKSKLVLILEDADVVLAPRNETDMAGISTLLNITDGIVGKLLNIRVVATTNSPAKALDKAITRPRRLCSHAIVEALEYSQAMMLYKKFGGEKELPEMSYTLAEIYDFALNPDAVIPEKKKIGF